MSGNAVALTIVIIMFVVVTLVGFAAARWRQAEDRLHLNEWGLGGRGFGIFITWFLLGGDIPTYKKGVGGIHSGNWTRGHFLFWQ